MSQIADYSLILHLLSLVFLSSSVICDEADSDSPKPANNSEPNGLLDFFDADQILFYGSQYGSLVVSAFGLIFSFVSMIMVIQVKRQVRKTNRNRKVNKFELHKLNDGHLSTISEVDYGLEEFDQA